MVHAQLPFNSPIKGPGSIEYLKVPIHSIKLVHEKDARVERDSIQDPDMVVTLLEDYLRECDRENFVVLAMDTKNFPISLFTVHVGSLSSSIVRPADVFKSAILCNAASIIVAHNHPSGDPEPSPEDIDVTRILCEAGDKLDIPVRDHIVLGRGGKFVSLNRRGFI